MNTMNIQDWRKHTPVIGRWDTRLGLEMFFMEDNFFDFYFLCTKRKTLVDREWLKRFLMERCNHPSRKKYIRLYKNLFEPPTKAKRGNRIYSLPCDK